MSDFSTSVARAARRFAAGAVRVFQAYATWLVGISWKRFLVLSALLLVLASLLEDVPPFSWTFDEDVTHGPVIRVPSPPPVPRAPSAPSASSAGRTGRGDDAGVVISIDDDGVRITSRPAAASGASLPGVAASAASAASGPTTEIVLPGASRDVIREVARAAREAAREAARDARQEAADARRDAEEARRDAAEAIAEAARDAADASAEARRAERRHVVRLVDSLPQLAFLFIVASAILKASYKAQIKAEVEAAAATETAESEQLKRQVVEARMAAMQAQVEPHFLFNTLASIDHLIETDPRRASRMQKNLIALLRASMPTLRDANPNAHNLGREMAVIRPYLEILKVRMEDRLQTDLQVPEGLLSAEFPSMMIQSLVENAIKHGLEPKAEGGLLTVKAEIVDGSLAVSVADTGLGFGQAATAGTGTGLANIRGRLQLLYGRRASVVVAEHVPSGTVVTVTVPYHAQRRESDAAA